MNKLLIIVIVAGLIYGLAYLKLNSRDPLMLWDWSKIDASKKDFPAKFVWGAASSAHQVEGGHQHINNFGWWEQQTRENGESTIVNGDKSGDAADHWRRIEEDTQLMVDLGIDSYRFSVSWSKIMPAPGHIDQQALQHYVDKVDTLIESGITPMITLHHFTHPLWFERLGAFENVENIQHFVRFAEVVYGALGAKVTQWCTINEPGVYMFDGYLSGMFPPGKNDPKLAAKVLENLMRAHVAVYQKIKSLPGGQSAQVGLVKNMMQMDAHNQYNLLDHFIKYFADNNYNQAILSLFKTDRFNFYMPTMVDRKASIEGASQSLDFIGLNYYSHYAFDFNGNIEESLEVKAYPGEVMTDMDYGIYPEGIYRAIKRISQLGVPIIITENGIADDKDDRRGDYIDRTLYAVSKAIEDGYDVRGYYYWSLTDNFEWNLGYGQRFGLYHVDFSTQKRKLKEGAKVYMDVIKQTKTRRRVATN
ncbi:MAG: glycoside hydrolase family 1 protein [Acidiferrobacterales bacterium]|nr:glycoside hydrolase family 1 protein [Acidiferrobacterales bacterium]